MFHEKYESLKGFADDRRLTRNINEKEESCVF